MGQIKYLFDCKEESRLIVLAMTTLRYTWYDGMLANLLTIFQGCPKTFYVRIAIAD